MKVSLVAVTQPVPELAEKGIRTADDLIAYAARVSSPQNQHKTETAPRLLRYCLRNGHWSVFETASMTLEIETSRAIAAQILRHRSFTFQEFSQRYAEADLGFEDVRPRRQDTKNRQNSTDDLDSDTIDWFARQTGRIEFQAEQLYAEALERGVAKECARFFLPLSTRTRLYMTGNARSWIHYFAQRCAPATQLEHREIALAAREIFLTTFPTVGAALDEVDSEQAEAADQVAVLRRITRTPAVYEAMSFELRAAVAKAIGEQP